MATLKSNLMSRWSMVIFITISIVFTSCSKEKPNDGNTTTINAKIVDINIFGNMELDINGQHMRNAGFEFGDVFSITSSSLPKSIEMPYVDELLVVGTYGICLNLIPDENKVALALTNGSFHYRVGGKVGDKVVIKLTKKGGFLETYRDLRMVKTDNREDYASDEEYANFFSVKCSGIKDGKLYRSGKPLMGPNNRYKYADELARKAGVKTIISMSDSEADWLKVVNSEDKVGRYSKEIYEQGGLGLFLIGTDFFQPTIAAEIGNLMHFMQKQSPPYLIHCSVGKDRTGLLSIMLGILGGATYDELEAGYMKSYYNYYHISTTHPKYKELKTMTLDRTLYIISKQGNVDIAQLNTMTEINVASFFAQLPAAVEWYFTELAGMTKAELSGVMDNLR